MREIYLGTNEGGDLKLKAWTTGSGERIMPQMLIIFCKKMDNSKYNVMLVLVIDEPSS